MPAISDIHSVATASEANDSNSGFTIETSLKDFFHMLDGSACFSDNPTIMNLILGCQELYHRCTTAAIICGYIEVQDHVHIVKGIIGQVYSNRTDDPPSHLTPHLTTALCKKSNYMSPICGNEWKRFLYIFGFDLVGIASLSKSGLITAKQLLKLQSVQKIPYLNTYQKFGLMHRKKLRMPYMTGEQVDRTVSTWKVALNKAGSAVDVQVTGNRYRGFDKCSFLDILLLIPDQTTVAEICAHLDIEHDTMQIVNQERALFLFRVQGLYFACDAKLSSQRNSSLSKLWFGGPSWYIEKLVLNHLAVYNQYITSSGILDWQGDRLAITDHVSDVEMFEKILKKAYVAPYKRW